MLSIDAAMQQRTDPRQKQGKRNPLALIWTALLVAKAAGETTLLAMAECRRLRVGRQVARNGPRLLRMPPLSPSVDVEAIHRFWFPQPDATAGELGYPQALLDHRAHMPRSARCSPIETMPVTDVRGALPEPWPSTTAFSWPSSLAGSRHCGQSDASVCCLAFAGSSPLLSRTGEKEIALGSRQGCCKIGKKNEKREDGVKSTQDGWQ